MFQQLVQSLTKLKKPAFVINDIPYSYMDLNALVRKYYYYLCQTTDERLIGLVMHNDLDTYAMLIATFLSDCGYVILNLAHPLERNTTIALDANLTSIFSSLAADRDNVPQNFKFFYPDLLAGPEIEVAYKEPNPDSLAYILFTSGSTGNPKGVQITKKNLSAFATSLASTPIAVHQSDNVLQMYDLTFDASILMLVPALYAGATIYTTDASKIKIIDIARILTTYPITYMFLVPSVMTLLRGYISEIRTPSIRMMLIGGEPVTKPVLDLIGQVAPNAELWNFYGPTEATVGVVITKIDQAVLDGCYNDIVPIGKPMPGVMDIVLDENGIVSEAGKKGELLVGGDQVTIGYVNDEYKNQNSFHYLEYKGKTERFYATGDLVFKNEHGDYAYCGRKDHQVKIQGYRIELNEIEYHARHITDRPVVVVASETDGNAQLYLFVEDYQGENDLITNYLDTMLPPFMVPKNIINVKQFPVTQSDKVDRVKLLELI